jgi:hypothetical protein
MKKQMAIGSAFAVALGLAACTPPAEEEGDAMAEEAVEAVEEAASDEDGSMDGEMTGEADAAEGEGEDGETAGPDQDGNPIQE